MRKLKLLLAACALTLGGVTASADELDITQLYLTNPSFENGDWSGWTTQKAEDTWVRGNATEGIDGNFLFNTWWHGYPIYQTVANLPEGSYTLSALAASTGGTFTLFVCTDESLSNEISKTSVNPTEENKFIPVSTDFSLTTAQDVVVGVRNSNNATAYDDAFWFKTDNFKLKLKLEGGATIPNAIVTKLLSSIPTGTMSTSVEAAMNSAINTFQSNATLANYNAVLSAMDAARKSIASYAIIANGTIPTDGIAGWAISTTNGELACNTWSHEGESDGSSMTTPFVQDWVGSGTALSGSNAGGKLYYTLTGLNPGEKYVVTARVRVFNEAGTGVSGANYFVGENSKSIDTEGSPCTGSFSNKGVFALISCSGTVDTEGKLQFGVELTATSLINWVSIKDVTIAEDAGIVPNKIELNESNVALTTGGLVKLLATVTPDEAADKTVAWSSSDESVATVSGGTVVALKAGTATITATSNAAPTVSASATITVTDAVAPSNYSTTITDGDYYIMNAATGKFFGGANSWGTQASIIKHGIPFNVTKVSDGIYTLDSHTYNSKDDHFFNGTYVDQGTTNCYITSIGNGKFSISTADGSNFVTVAAGSTVVENNATNTNNTLAQWYFLSREDLLKSLTTATSTNPGDATFYLDEANISPNLRKSNGNSAWKGSFSYGGNNDNQCAESINKTHNVYQTVSVPNGTYVVKAQGFYRPGASAIASYLYANDQEVALKKYNEETLPAESMAGASTAFTAGRFWNEVEVTVTDNKLTIGVKTDATDSWTIWDNFELYLKNSTGLNVAPTIADGDYYLTADAGATYIYRGADSGTQGTLSADNYLYANVKTDIAGISTITFKDTNLRLFWNEEMVYTNGTLHVQKNYHHPYWAIEKDGENYKLRNIETGLYLAVGTDVVTAATTASTWTFDSQATDSQISEAKGAASNYPLGFEKGEYAPYNNVTASAIASYANALDVNGEYPSLKVIAAKNSVDNAAWTVNAEQMNAFYDGDFSECAEDTTTPLDVAPTGWTPTANMRMMLKNATDYPGLADASATSALMSWSSGVTYGEQSGYEMPLAANATYRLTFKAAGWNNESRSGITVSVLNATDGLEATDLGTPDCDIKGNASNTAGMTSFEKVFTTGAAGNYIFKIKSGNNMVVTDFDLRRPTPVYAVVGGKKGETGNSSIFSGYWDAETTKDFMTLNGGIYTKTFENQDVDPQTIEYKVIKKDYMESPASSATWYTSNGTSNMEINFRIKARYNITFSFDESTSTVSSDTVKVAEAVTISDKGWATTVTNSPLNFDGSGVEAYTATVADSKVSLKKVDNVKAETGLVLKGNEGTYYIPVAASSETDKGSLMFSSIYSYNTWQPTDGSTNTFYGLKVTNSEAKFAKLDVANGTAIPAQKAFLLVNTPAGSTARSSFDIVFDGETTTGIDGMTTEKNVEGIYNMNGQRVNKAQKGLYIMNGKKVVVK